MASVTVKCVGKSVVYDSENNPQAAQVAFTDPLTSTIITVGFHDPESINEVQKGTFYEVTFTETEDPSPPAADDEDYELEDPNFNDKDGEGEEVDA